jgi:hypothetical protein
MDYMILKTIVTSIAAATIALAAPAHADNGKTVCASMGNRTTHAQAICRKPLEARRKPMRRICSLAAIPASHSLFRRRCSEKRQPVP